MPLTALICSGAFASEKMTILTKKERGKYHKVPPSRCSEHMMARDFRDDIVMKVVGWFLSPSHSTGFLCNFFILLAISSGLLVDTFCTCMGMGGASLRVPQVFLQHWIEIREGGGGRAAHKLHRHWGQEHRTQGPALTECFADSESLKIMMI